MTFSPPLPAFLPPDWMEAVAAADSFVELQRTVAALVRRLGFGPMAFGMVDRRGNLVLPALFSDYPADWLDRYLGRGYLDIDPVVQRARERVGVYAWDELPVEGQTAAQRRFMAEAADFGVRDGLSVSMRGDGGMAVFSACAAGSAAERPIILRRSRDSLSALALATFERTRRLFPAFQAPPRPLTGRERECVQWLVAGKTGTETALILGISELTVNQHIKSAMRKLDVLTRVHLGVRAVALGLVEPA